MGYRELFTSYPLVFGGLQTSFEESTYVIVGVPFDATSTYRVGARFAPTAVREASLNIETYSFRTGLDLEDVKLHDAGDLDVAAETDETLKRLELVTRELLKADKIPVFIGGEHTITLGAMRGVDGGVAVLSFDAHLDLRNEYMGRTTSHTTFMRRINEEVRPPRIVEVGTRAVCKEELSYAEESKIPFLTLQQIRKDGVQESIANVTDLVASYEKIYLTIDIDVLDPAFAPAAQNPEPDGLCVNTFLDILCSVCDRRIAALDLVEVAPQYDNGVTAAQAAKTIFEVLCHMERARRG